MTSKSFGLTLAVAFACAFLPFAGMAQTFRGHVRGEITDPGMAVLSGATVTLLNVATGIKTVKTTDSSGLYVFDLVDAGTYSLTVEAAGFQKFVQQNVIVQSGGDVTVNASLSPGTLQQTVTVEATPPAVEFNSTNKELIIDTKMANDTRVSTGIRSS